MQCNYCFYLQKAEMFPEPVHRMHDELLQEMIRQVMSQSGPLVSFGWQGGEPTLVGLPFFQMAVTWQMHYGAGQSVGNGLQTNGLLLNSHWGKFLHENQFLVGLSLDGPEHIHDHYRRMAGGQGTWSTVVDNAKLLLDAGVAANALSVVTDYSSQYAEEIYQFHKDLGLTHMQFIPCVETDSSDPTRAASFSVSPEKYGNFLITLFDLWLSDVHGGVATTSVRYFDSVFHTYVGLSVPDCTLAELCGNYLVIEHNGDVYSCDFFVEPRWRLGNVLEGQLIDMLNSPRQREFGAIKAARPVKCSGCRWLRLCYGGCTKDRVRDPADRGTMHFCQSHTMFFEHADRPLRDLASTWLRRQRPAATGTIPDESLETAVRQGRNDLCPCGSGKKYKRCCGADVLPGYPAT